MRARAKYSLIILLVALATATAISAFAFPVAVDSYNGVFFRNSEVFVDYDDNGLISQGDVFWGVLSLNGVTDAGNDASGQTGPYIWPIAPGPVFVQPYEITGYFAQLVTNVIDNGNGTYNLIFGAAGAADPNGILDANEAIQIFESNTVNFNDASQASALSTATDGTPTFSLGFGTNNYWFTPNVAIDPNFQAGADVGVTYAGLDYITLPPWAFAQVNDPNESVFDFDVDFWFNSEIFSFGTWNGPDTNTKMHFGSNDPGVHYPVPEPSTFLLLGGGLVGLLVLRRKQSRS